MAAAIYAAINTERRRRILAESEADDLLAQNELLRLRIDALRGNRNQNNGGGSTTPKATE